MPRLVWYLQLIISAVLHTQVLHAYHLPAPLCGEGGADNYSRNPVENNNSLGLISEKMLFMSLFHYPPLCVSVSLSPSLFSSLSLPSLSPLSVCMEQFMLGARLSCCINKLPVGQQQEQQSQVSTFHNIYNKHATATRGKKDACSFTGLGVAQLHWQHLAHHVA